MNQMWEMLPLIVMFLIVPIIIKMLSDNKTRRKLIEKGLVDEKVKYLFMNKPGEYVSSSLKWGMVLIAVGLAVFVGQLAPKELVPEVTLGAMLVLGGLALIIYYAIARRKIDEDNKTRLDTDNRL